MALPGEWMRRLRYRIDRRYHDEALKAEMDAHREMLPSPARFGNVVRLREDAHDAWGWRWLDDLGRDTRLAARLLLRSRGFTGAVVASLAFALVLLVSTFAVVNAYLLRSLPYAGADRLYNVTYAPSGPWEPDHMSALDWDALADVVEFPITAAGDTFYLADGAYAQSARGLRVSRSFVEGLGVRSHLGRVLDERDWRQDSDRVAMIGYSLWRDRYGSDPAVLGRMIRADTESERGRTPTVRIVGVLAPEFYFGADSLARVDLLLPLTASTRTYLARLRAGVPVAVAERRITDAARQLATNLPADWTGVHLESTHERYVRGLRPVLIGVTAAACLILVLVCVNVAILSLLRTLRRQKEMAIRVAIGAGRWRLARMLGIEAALLVGAAAGVGVVLAHLTLRVLGTVIEERLGRPAPNGPGTLSIDWTVLLVVAAVGLMVSMLLAWLPVFAPWEGRIGQILRPDRASSTEGRGTRNLRGALLTLQVAGTFVLLVAGGLLMRSTLGMLRTDLGFSTAAVIRSRVALRGADYADGPAFFRFYTQFAEAVSGRTHGQVVFSSWVPFDEFPKQTVQIDQASGVDVEAGVVEVGAGYLETLGIRLSAGRDIAVADEREGAPVAIVSETLARQLWPGAAAIGRQVRTVQTTPAQTTVGPWRTVVGVAGDVRQGYFDPTSADLYTPLTPAGRGRYGSFYLRTELPAGTVFPILRTVASELDPHAIISAPVAVAAANKELQAARFLTHASSGIAAGVLLLAILGIYAVTGFSVHQRAREMAVRMALGATARTIRALYLRDIGVVLCWGVALGLGAALALSRGVESYLYGVPAWDMLTISGACVLLTVAGLAAAWGPVRSAARAAPVTVLKEG